MKKIYLLIFLIYIIINSPAKSQNLNQGLVAYFPFTGNANDSGPNSISTTIYGDVTLTSDKDGNANRAYNFNGNIKSYITLAPNAALNMGSGDMTISAWFNLNGSLYSNMSIFNNASGFTTGIWFGIDMDSQNTFGLLVGGNSVSNSMAIRSVTQPANFRTSWHHAIAIVDRTNNVAKLYLDGVQVGIQHYTKYGTPGGTINGNNLDITGLPLNLNGYTTSAMGAYVNGATVINRFDGMMDELRIYNRVLTNAEISLLGSGSSSIASNSGPETKLNVYPNPNNGSFKISCNENMKDATIKIFNSLGEVVYHSFKVNDADIVIENIQSGLYFVQLSLNGKIINQRFVKE